MAYKSVEPIVGDLQLYNGDLIDRVQNDPNIGDDELLVEVLRRNADGLNLSDDDALLQAWTGKRKNPTEPGVDASWTWKQWMDYNNQSY